MRDNTYDVIIIGGGAAGLTAGIYTCRAGLKTLMLERLMPGGQVINAGKHRKLSRASPMAYLELKSGR